MAGYSSARKLTNVVGRVDYISNPERQEKMMVQARPREPRTI